LDLTEVVGWVGEKASQFKLQSDDSSGGFGTFEALETLALGIQGKLALWQALPLIREVDARVPSEDFGRLAVRADEQYTSVENRRRQLIHATFRQKPKEESSAYFIALRRRTRSVGIVAGQSRRQFFLLNKE
jgi:hypothetical protein